VVGGGGGASTTGEGGWWGRGLVGRRRDKAGGRTLEDGKAEGGRAGEAEGAREEEDEVVARSP
jgi:hypothetical protein